MEEILIDTAKVAPVIALFALVCSWLQKRYLEEKRARIAIQKEFVEYLKGENDEKTKIIEQDTAIKVKLLRSIEGAGKKNGG